MIWWMTERGPLLAVAGVGGRCLDSNDEGMLGRPRLSLVYLLRLVQVPSVPPAD